ncbi:hypothetical protein OUZ56_022233 [Daphnia magna]|uniref:Uncharacterized protein n=1 Tax=Daphnia magna TaxID=35525 RepID=A0ABR0AVQ9_9CRUS|nr:hypothetical protein OUZ56_022233 [Daphnia magna]
MQQQQTEHGVVPIHNVQQTHRSAVLVSRFDQQLTNLSNKNDQPRDNNNTTANIVPAVDYYTEAKTSPREI